jgi:hypothetical protein
MKAISLCLSLVLAGAAYGQSVVDGFYFLSDDESAPSALSQDGNRLLLGGPQEIVVERSEILSQDNANTQYWVTIVLPFEPGFDASSLVLVVSGQGYEWAGSGSGRENFQVSFSVSGADSALDVSQYLNAPIIYRRHPAHQFLVSFVPRKELFQIGDDVLVTLSITNVGNNSVSFMQGGMNRAARDNQFVFSARLVGRQVQDIGTTINFGGLAVVRTLRPGEEFVDEISLNKWFSFDQAGRYEVHGSYFLRFSDPDGLSHGTIWTDYVSSDFVVRIDD